MTTAAFKVALHSFRLRRPFEFFLLEFKTGERIEVRHPEAVMLRGPMLVYRSPHARYRLFDASSVCELLDPPPGAE